MTGVLVRLRRIFQEDRRAVVVALDHGQHQGALAGLVPMPRIVRAVADGGADAIILNPGAAVECATNYAGRCALILRVTGASTRLNPAFDYHRQICSVERAASLGADAVIAMGFVGGDGESASLELLARIAGACQRAGMPLIAEMLPLDDNHFQDPEWIGIAARAGYEIGANVIKAYTTSTEADRAAIEGCAVPFLAAGGAKSANASDIAAQAIARGAAGVAFGRNVFGAENPRQVVRDLVRAVHGG